MGPSAASDRDEKFEQFGETGRGPGTDSGARTRRQSRRTNFEGPNAKERDLTLTPSYTIVPIGGIFALSTRVKQQSLGRFG